MSKFLREWLVGEVNSKLKQLLDDERIQGKSVLNIPVRKLRPIQLVHFSNDSLHTVSDGRTSVEAEFADAALELFQNENSRSFFDLLGAIVTIKDFDIVLDLGTASQASIRLFIRDFKLRGSEGSDTGRPSNILQAPDVQQTLEQILLVLQGDHNDLDTVLSWSQSPIRSQDGNPSDRLDLYPALPSTSSQPGTQMATQIPGFRECSVKSKEASTKPQNGLLALLKNQREAPKVATSSPVSILQPVPEQRVKEMTTMLDAKANKQQSQFATQYDFDGVHTAENQFKTSQPSQAMLHMHSPSSDSEKENSQESLNRVNREAPLQTVTSTTNTTTQEASRQKVTSTTSITMDRNRDNHPMGYVDLFQDEHPFTGLKRVPRKFVRIPHAQKALLDREDCWYEPNSGERTSYAILPPNAREEIDTFLDRPPERAVQDPSDDSSDESVADAEDDNSEEDEEEQPALAKSTQNLAHERQLRESATPSISRAASITTPRRIEAANLNLDLEIPSTSSPNEKAYPIIKDDGADTSEDESIQECPSQPSAEDKPRYPITINESMPSIARPRMRMPLVPCPSPVDEEEDELELRALYAVGDVVEEEKGVIETLVHSQELPCTAPFNPKQVQVEQTPVGATRAIGSNIFDAREVIEMGTNVVLASQDIPEFVPATFDNAKSSPSTSSSAPRTNGIEHQEQEAFSSLPTPKIPADAASRGHTSSPSQDGSESVFECAEEPSNSPVIQCPAISGKEKQVTPSASSPIVPRILKRTIENASPGETLPACQSRSPVAVEEYNRTKVKNIGRAFKKNFIDKLRASDAPVDHGLPKSPVASSAREAGHRVDPTSLTDVRISSTYADSTIANNLSSEEPIPGLLEPTLDHLIPSNAHTPHQAISQVFPDLRSPSPEDNFEIALEEMAAASSDPADARTSPLNSDPIPANDSVANHTGPDLGDTSSINSTQPMFYDEFKATYPDYEGSKESFTRALVYLEWIEEQDDITLPIFLDDFIKFMDVVYPLHAEECKKSGIKTPTGIAFYNSQVAKHIYVYGIITSDNLQAALGTLDQDYVEKIRKLFKPSGQSSQVSDKALVLAGNKEKAIDVNLDDYGTGSSKKQSQMGYSATGTPFVPPENSSKPLRNRFFETLSQIHLVKPQKAVELPHDARIGNQEDGNPTSSAPPRSGVKSKAEHSTTESPAHENPPSPILGSLRDSSPEPRNSEYKTTYKSASDVLDDPFITKAVRRTTLPAKGINGFSEMSRELKRKRDFGGSQNGDIGDDFATTSKPSKAARGATMPAHTLNGAKRTEDWVRVTPLKKRLSFEEKVARRIRERDFVPKRAIIPRLTGKTFCTSERRD